MQGKIVKGIAGFYYVDVVESGVYECKAKGGFRRDGKKPLVGDNVEICVLDEDRKVGSMTEILPRKNQLIRPAAANVDQALVVFAAARPKPHFNLLDRFLVRMEREKIPVILCFNKEDIVTEEDVKALEDIYGAAGYPLIFTSAKEETNIEILKKALRGKTTVLAGPSGVGKSSLVNRLIPEADMETGEISRKIERGKHTTRHSQLFLLGQDSYLMDTPGFSSLSVLDFEKEELKAYFPEFARWEEACRFHGCDHIHEPGCKVKEKVEEGAISPVRYKSYQEIYEELRGKRRY